VVYWCILAVNCVFR